MKNLEGGHRICKRDRVCKKIVTFVDFTKKNGKGQEEIRDES